MFKKKNLHLPNVLKDRDLSDASYPIKGIIHLIRHPRKHAGPILVSIIKVATTSAVVALPIYKYGYGFQKSILSHFYKSLDHPVLSSSLMITATTSLLCFLETSAATLQLGVYFLGNIRNRLFDSVLEERKGFPDADTDLAVVSEKVSGLTSDATEKMVNEYRFLSPMHIMIMSAQQEDTWSVFFLRPALFLMALPLNIVPVLGPISFVAIQALFRGGLAHKRYFQLFKWTYAQRQCRIETHFWQYQRFGMVATALEMIPFAGYLFMCTNQIGGALWAMDLHDRQLLEPSLSSKRE